MYLKSNISPENLLKERVHTGVVCTWAAGIIEEALRVPLAKIQSAAKRAEIVDARTLFISLCIGSQVTPTALAIFLGKTNADITYHLQRFKQLVNERDRHFTRKLETTINRQKSKKVSVTDKNGDQFISKEMISQIVEKTLQSLGIPQAVESLAKPKEQADPTENNTVMQEATQQWIEKQKSGGLGGKSLDTAINIPEAQKNQLGGKAI